MSTSAYKPAPDPHEPPYSLLHPDMHSTALYRLIGALVAVWTLAGVVGLFWAASHPRHKLDASEGDLGGRFAYYSSQGGHNPVPRPRNTRDELKFRGFPSGY